MTRKFPDMKAWLRSPRHLMMVGAGVLVAVLVLLALPAFGASSPAFFSRYHLLTRSYDNLEASAHQGIACSTCHTDPRGQVVYGLAVAVDFYTSLVSDKKEPAFVSFDKPGRDACLQCHADGWSMHLERTSTIPHPAHLRISDETRECVDCHKWTAHEEAYIEKHKKMPFSGVCVAYGCHVGTKTADECFSCHHVLSDDGPNWKTEHPKFVQKNGVNACLETCHEPAQCQQCHTTGVRPKFTGLAIETSMKAIEDLHTLPTWMERHGAEAVKDQAKCMKCHVSDGECRSCHANRPESHGSGDTWIGSHSKKADGEDDRACLTCHEKPWCEECHTMFKEMR
jgi:hypothetical protein